MITLITVVFLLGYIFIALEHPLRIDKAATALVTGIVLWMLYVLIAMEVVPTLHAERFAEFLSMNPSLADLSLSRQVIAFVEQIQVVETLGEISETLFFLIGAMTIVELIDVHGGFNIITNRITTRNKRPLLWIIGVITFCMSATLDNLTTSIVMITLLRKIIANYKERWLFAGIIIIAANAGGAWSPIGDVTTIMLWVRGNITTAGIMPSLFVPCLVAFVVPTTIASFWLHGSVTPAPLARLSVPTGDTACVDQHGTRVTQRQRLTILILGVLCLISVPVFKTITHLPPFMGILLALGIMWIYTEIMYRRTSSMPEFMKARVPYILRRIDTSTILFFLGILMAVAALQASGILESVSLWLDTNIHNVYIINLMVGLLSSIVDNVPLVAGSIATYDVLGAADVAAAVDPAYATYFMQDGIFWKMLAYCAGVGGSILIIGSAAGVVVMGLERMNFMWYLRNISLIALAGYLAGAGTYILISLI